jgi:hypothetical protein
VVCRRAVAIFAGSERVGFTGAVGIDPLFQAPDPALVQRASVTLEPERAPRGTFLRVALIRCEPQVISRMLTAHPSILGRAPFVPRCACCRRRPASLVGSNFTGVNLQEQFHAGWHRLFKFKL